MNGLVDERLAAAREAQGAWAATPLALRLRHIARLRVAIADHGPALAARTGRADQTEALVSEVLPLADACRFLERNAAALLRPTRLGRRGRPFWLSGVAAELRREPLGLVLVIGPSNYPLFLPGVQLLQGLAAGNAVAVKPGRGGTPVMEALIALAAAAGIDVALMPLLDEDPACVDAAIGAGIDKVVLTGSSGTGAAVLGRLAPHLVPASMELSGNDCVIVLPRADLDMVAAALAYGMRLNGSATCIAPRRVFMVGQQIAPLIDRLWPLLERQPPVALAASVLAQRRRLLEEAESAGATLIGGIIGGEGGYVRPTIVRGGSDGLGLCREDLFAPVLTFLEAETTAEAARRSRNSPYALGAAIFGPARQARALAAELDVGIVTINDLIVTTADPRLPFGGRHRSGFGATRGAAGLLEMTALKAISVRAGRFRPHYTPLDPSDGAIFAAYLRAAHGGKGRWRAAASVIRGLAKRGVGS